MDALTIGQLAGAAGVNIETVRFYERRGLLRRPPRTAAGYRQYSDDDLWRLRFIARAKRLGFTLNEISALTGAGESELVLSHARHKIGQLRERQAQLAVAIGRLEQLVEICSGPDRDDCMALTGLS